ncbi:hypothetical protein BU17DRAFT_94094 [Hysterangium stoloniferum]|nr:hypothetical protein BU17DRAFT_94094 [Hysterangium stoloniferum]
MDAEQYIPRIFDGDSHSVASPQSDISKWAAVHEALENPDGKGLGSKSATGSLFTMAWVLGITLALLWVLMNGRTVLTQWQETVHRRASRRRHGIPDNDDRPFNVAYAAAALARRERELEQHRKVKLEPLHTQGTSEQHGQSLGARQRITQTTGSNPQQNVFIQSAATSHLSPQAQQYVPVASASSIQPRKLQGVEPQNLPGMYSPDRSHQVLPDIYEESQPSVERRKHNQVEESDNEDRAPKKTRVNDGNDGRREQGVSRRGSLQIPKRGAKRQANAGDEDDWEMSQDKRARMGSGGHPDQVSDSENVDMEIYSSEADGQDARGTKRGRDPSAVDDTDELSHPRPRRKRRAAEKYREVVEGVSLRGHKRDRSLDDSDTSDLEEDVANISASRRKRSRRSGVARRDTIDTTDTSESDESAEISKDPACGGRRLGEIWEVNGQSFKVGLDGRRLRQALVKQRRSKFPMPRDSIHYDAKTDVEVIVEKWLNDAEYKVAKDNAELAWQASPTSTPSTSEPKKQLEESPVFGGGKRLLSEGPPSPLKGRMSLRPAPVANPFDLAPSNAGRRSSAAHALVNMVPESPKLRSSKSLSKWEKQDLEAMSFKQLQARQKEKEREKEKESEKEREREPVKAAISPLTPSTNIQAAPTSEKGPFAIPKIFKNEPKTSLTSATPPTTASAAKPETTPAAAATLSFATSTPVPSTIPSFTTSAPSTVSTPPTGKIPSFSFSSQASTTSSGATAAPVSDASKPQSSKPSFSFTSAPTGALFETAKPTFKNPFDKAASQPHTSTATPVPASTSVSSPFAFGSSTQPKPQTGSQQTPFTFGLPGGAQKPAELSSATLGSGSGPSSGSLLSRVGPIEGSAQSSQESSNSLFGGKGAFTSKDNTTDTSKGNASPFGGLSSGTTEPAPSASSATAASASLPSGFTVDNAVLTPPFKVTINASPAPLFGATKAPSTSTFGATTSATPASAFGATSNTLASAFGNSGGGGPSAFGFTGGSKPSPSPFGISNTSKNIFEQGATKNAAGQASSEQSKNIFGQLASDSVKSAFGPSASEPAKNVFGPSASEPTKNVFGPSASEPAKNVFGPSMSEPAKNVFGPSASEPAKNVFGPSTSELAKNAFGQVTSETTKSIFGTTPADPSKSIFNSQSSSSDPSKNIFGGGSEASKNIFGQPSTPASATDAPKSGGIVFGKPSGPGLSAAPDGTTQTKPAFSFGFGTSNPSPPTTTEPSASSSSASAPFGQPKSAFGQSLVFGQPSVFGQSSTTSQSAPSGQTSTGSTSSTSNPTAFSFPKPAESEKK